MLPPDSTHPADSTSDATPAGASTAPSASADRLALLRLQLDACPDAILLVQGQQLIEWNRRLLELWNLEKTRVSELSLESLFQVLDQHRVDSASLRQAVATAETEGRSFAELALPDGRILAAIVQNGPATDAPTKAIVFRDVTLERRVEVLLRTRAEQQNALAVLSKCALREPHLQRVFDEAVRCVTHTLNLDSCVLLELQLPERTVRHRASLGWPVEVPFTGAAQAYLEFIHAQHGNVVFSDFGTELRFEVPETFRHHRVRSGFGVALYTPTGPFGYLLAQSRASRPKLETDASFIASVANILGEAVRRHRLEEALRLSEGQLRSLVEMSPDGMAIVQDERFVFVNRRLAEMLGYGVAEEVLDTRPTDLVHPEDRTLAFADKGRALVAPSTPSVPETYRILARDGRVLWVDASVMPFEYRGRPALVSVIRDVTKQKQLQSQLMLSDRMASVGRLAAGAAHELNNPLAYIHSNLVFARNTLEAQRTLAPPVGRDEPTLEVLEALQEAQQGAERMRVIIRDLKSFSRADEEKREPVSLQRVLDASINMAWNEIRHRAQLVRRYVKDPFVLANEARLGQVFVNLLINASHAIREGNVADNTIEVVVDQTADGKAVAEVRDTGSGIPKATLTRIFDPFFTTKPVGVGTGLGLPICHNLVSALGGTIDVESEEGKGTVFRVVLPLGDATQTVAPEPAVAPVERPPRRGRILILDDDVMVLRSLMRTLRNEHDVVTTSSPSELLARAHAGEHFDVVLCDVMMPEMSGVDVYQQLSRIAPHWLERFVFFTGGAFTERTQKFLEGAQVPRLEKPIAPDALRRFLRERLQR